MSLIKGSNNITRINNIFSVIITFFLGILLGFSFYSSNPMYDNPFVSKTKNTKNTKNTKVVFTKSEIILRNNEKWQAENNIGENTISGTPYYTDNFNTSNDTASLKNRGYKIYYRGSGIQGSAPVWFQGNAANIFSSLNGPDSGYVAANYMVVAGLNNIDSWLVLPGKNTTANDRLVFFCRSPFLSTYPDSVRVMYSAAGDTTPEAAWTELGRFKTITSGSWERKTFTAPSSGANARFAIRYKINNGGPLGNNSDYIGIDSLSIETSIANDISAASIVSPAGITSLPSAAFAPKAIFKNEGSVNQTNIPVTFKITGPVSYTSSRTIASLNSGASVQVIFDSTFVPAAGTFSARAYSGMASDQNRNNDTIKSNIKMLFPNYGNGAGYFYSNSIASGAAKPEFCWKDTTGSKSLIVNKTIVAANIFTGDIDDGYFRLGNILGGYKIKFGGVSYDSVFIGTNGLIGFSLSGNNHLNNFTPDTGSVEAPAFYPMWEDFNFGNRDAAINRLSYKVINGFQLIVTYDRAPLYNAAPTEYVSFQVMMDVVDNFYPRNSRLLVQYADTTGGKTGSEFFTKYNNNLLPLISSGLATSLTNKVFYRFSTGSNLVYPGPILGPSSLAVQFGPDSGSINSSCSGAALNLTASIESITPAPIPSSHTGDTISVFLRETVSPFEIADGDRKFLNSSGSCLLNFSKISTGKSYYIVIKHRSALETWSKAGLLLSSPVVNYDFTTGADKAFGDNMTIVNGKASFYAGDVNQDGTIDLSDGGLIDNDIFNFATGYIRTDVNNDSVTDITDATYADNNAFYFVGLVRP